MAEPTTAPLYMYSPPTSPRKLDVPPPRVPHRPWIGIAGCVVAVALLTVSIIYLVQCYTPSPPRPTPWLEFYESWTAVPAPGIEKFEIIKGGRAGTGDPVLKDIIDLFQNAKDPEVAAVARRLMYHEDTVETYTQTKSDVYMCLRDHAAANKEYYSKENLAYVMAHELAHAWMKDYDPQHKTSEFHDKHQRVLDSVTTENFVPTPPTTYCANVPA